MIKRKKIVTMAIAILIVCSILLNNISIIYAAGFNVSASTNTVSAGGSFNVYISLNGEGKFSVSGSNASVSTSELWCISSCSVGVSAGSAGTAYVTITAVDASTPSYEPITGSQTVSINVQSTGGGNSGGSSGGSSGGNSGGSSGGGSSNTSGGGNNTTNNNSDDPANADKSSDNTLASLSVTKGTLDPAFSADVTNYKVTLPADQKTITIEAAATDSKASVENTGEHEVKVGNNEIGIAVTAENGDVKTYVINAYVDETPVAFMTYQDKKLGVVRNVDNVEISDKFEKTTIKFENQEVPAWINKQANNLTLVYLINENGDKDFYIYEEGKGITSIYKPITLFDMQYAIIDVPEEMKIRTGMEFKDVEIATIKMPGWTFEETAFERFTIVYLMNEEGKAEFYQFDKDMNNLQHYAGASITQDAYEEMLKNHEQTLLMQWCIIGALIITNILAIGTTIYMIVKNKKNRRLQNKLSKAKFSQPEIDDEVIEEYDPGIEMSEFEEPFDNNSDDNYYRP